uniref:Sodefrin-like factor 31 n=1 Tax=Lissotriton helveticus TaxID=256425 RepID=A0A0B5GV15_9SALA|nr:sodefrin precursor-like factor 31 [Lissotriton helveticus]
MRSFAASATLFLVFIAAGNAIECEVCIDRVSLDCSGELVTCNETVKSCQTAITEYTFEGLDPIHSVFKNCSGLETKTNMYRSAVTKGLYQQGIEICQTNGCNKAPIHFTPINRTLNGVKCPSCNVNGALSCEVNGVVECVGELTNCIYMAAKLRLPGAPANESIAYRGFTSAENEEQYLLGLSYRLQNIVTLEISKGI